MSCRSESTSPNSRHGDGTRCDHPVGQCPQNCPTVEIEINDTPATNDDLVLLKCEHPSRRHNISCRIRSTSSGDTHSVVLTNPDGRLRFPNSGDTTKSLTVRDDGRWVSFEISGERGSDAMNDAVIQAMDIATPGTYSLSGGRLTATGGNTVDYEMAARIRPNGVDCSAPQIANLQIGLKQDCLEYKVIKTWSSPTIAWNPGVATGTEATVPDRIRLTIRVATSSNDTEATVAPLYDQPGKGGTLDANSLKSPIGCTGGGNATTRDTPSSPFPATFQQNARDAAGNAVGVVTYSRDVIEIQDRFIAWCVVFNTRTNDYCALKERNWEVMVSSTGGAGQKATVHAVVDPTTTPVTTPITNTAANDPANRATGPVGAGTTKFTAP
jgi:hypothetical protein